MIIPVNLLAKVIIMQLKPLHIHTRAIVLGCVVTSQIFSPSTSILENKKTVEPRLSRAQDLERTVMSPRY